MIQQITKITGTGKFQNFQRKGLASEKQLSNFQKINTIFGLNGTGKTTFSMVFRSLKGNNELMAKRRSFNKKLPQEIELLFNNEPISFGNNQWSRHLSNIEVFDVHFINENIFTGLEIQSDHKKKLFEVILGDEGVKLKNEIQHLRTRIRNGKKVIRDASKMIEAAIDNAFSAMDYVYLEDLPDIDSRIKEKESELETAQSFQIIAEKSNLTLLPIINFPYESEMAREVLATSIESISEEYLEKLQTHKEHLKIVQNPEEWLKAGFENMSDDCPFCQQKIDKTSTIIKAYQQYFNEAYNTLLDTLKDLKEILASFNLVATLLETENRIIGNLSLIDFWKKHLPNAPNLQSILDKKEHYLHLLEELKNDFHLKLENPVQTVTTKNLNIFDKELTSLNQKLKEYNEQISNFNQSIQYMKTVDAPNIPQIELELKQVRALKKRQQPELAENCDNLKKYAAGIEILNKRQEDCQTQLRIFQEGIFANFLKQTNRFLKDFAPYLEIKNLTSYYHPSGYEPMAKYGLFVHGTEVQHKDHATKASLKFALSEGDKSALALSFFFAKLTVDPDLSQKIIVIDDSVSSFDRFRLSKMINYLLDFGSKATQLFFLSHNHPVAKEFAKRGREKGLEILEGKIEEVGGSSSLVKG